MRKSIDDLLILADNNFASIEKVVIQTTKIMANDKKYFTFAQYLKLNSAQIKLDSNSIVLIKDNYVDNNFLFINYNANFTSIKELLR